MTVKHFDKILRLEKSNYKFIIFIMLYLKNCEFLFSLVQGTLRFPKLLYIFRPMRLPMLRELS